MDWIVRRGVEKIPDGVSFEQASFVEPLNTCLKAVEQCAPSAEDLVVVMGQGPIGLLFTMLLKDRGVRVVATDTIARRLELSRRCGAEQSWDARTVDVGREVRALTGGRGADVVIVATAVKGLVEQAVEWSRPGAKVCLFAQTSDKEQIELSGASICVAERMLFGSYSASVDLQKLSADLVFSGRVPVDLLISHTLPLASIKEAFDLATKPTEESLKIIVQCNRR
jgi:L-iditol 2-dehydrogenase